MGAIILRQNDGNCKVVPARTESKEIAFSIRSLSKQAKSLLNSRLLHSFTLFALSKIIFALLYAAETW